MGKIVPKFARVILRRHKAVKKGSIMMPESVQKKYAEKWAVVESVGPTCDDSIKPGMTVIIGEFAGAWQKEKDSDEEFYCCQDEDIIAEWVE